MPNLYIIAGPNGAGKTTAAMTLLPEYLHVREFVNADEIARGLSPFNPKGAEILAGRLMLARIHQLADANKDFAFETTLASRSFVPFIKKLKQKKYHTHLFFLWLQTPELALRRVALRVASGGHNVPKKTLVRRYHAGLDNLFSLYMPIVNTWRLLDNSSLTPEIIAEKSDDNISILKESLWQSIKP